MNKNKKGAAPCLIKAWEENKDQIYVWLKNKTNNNHLAQDLLQDLFIRAMNTDKNFCNIINAKAWLFKVAGNLVIDSFRKPNHEPFSFDILEEIIEHEPVDNLADCLPIVLKKLKPQDSELITACDIEGITQKDYAIKKGITLPATKSRLRRARAILKDELERSCQIKLDANQKVCCFTPENKNN